MYYSLISSMKKQNIVTNGLILYLDAAQSISYPGTGIIWNDLSINANNGTLVNGPTYSSSNGGSIVFDGTNDYVNIPFNSTLNTPNGATYEIWIKPAIGTSGEFLNRGTSDSGATPDNPRFSLESNGKLYFDWSSPSNDRYLNTVTGSCNMGYWNQVIGLATPNSLLRVFVNGVESSYLQRVGTLPSTLPNTSNPIQLGGAPWIPRYSSSNISILKLYNRSLSAAEILQNYNVLKQRYI